VYILLWEVNGFISLYHSVITACLGKILFSRYRAKRAKVGGRGAVGEIRSKTSVLQHIFNLVHQISIKPSGNDLGIKRVVTDEFNNTLAHSCPGMPMIWTQIRSYWVPKYAISKISQIWFIRFWWNFQEMFLVWKDLRLMNLITSLPIIAWACPWFWPKFRHIWSQNMPFLGYLTYGSSDFDETFSNVFGMKRVETDEVHNMLAHSYLGMPMLLAQIWPYLVSKYAVLRSHMWVIRFKWNFEEMFTTWKESKFISFVTCLPIFAQACPWFRPFLVRKYVFKIFRIWFIRFYIILKYHHVLDLWLGSFMDVGDDQII